MVFCQNCKKDRKAAVGSVCSKKEYERSCKLEDIEHYAIAENHCSHLRKNSFAFKRHYFQNRCEETCSAKNNRNYSAKHEKNLLSCFLRRFFEARDRIADGFNARERRAT